MLEEVLTYRLYCKPKTEVSGTVWKDVCTAPPIHPDICVYKSYMTCGFLTRVILALSVNEIYWWGLSSDNNLGWLGFFFRQCLWLSAKAIKHKRRMIKCHYGELMCFCFMIVKRLLKYTVAAACVSQRGDSGELRRTSSLVSVWQSCLCNTSKLSKKHLI